MQLTFGSDKHKYRMLINYFVLPTVENDGNRWLKLDRHTGFPVIVQQ